MRQTISFIFIFVLAFAGVAVADPLNYTVMGYGGLSPAVAGVSENSFWWAATNTAGATVPGSMLTSYGFDPLSGSARGVTPAPYSSNNLFSGSLLLSTPFTVSGTQALTVSFGELAVRPFAYGNFEFAVLLNSSTSQVAALLGIESPMTLVGTEDQNYLGTFFTPLSPGVQMTTDYYHGAYPANFTLGGIQYDQCSGDHAGPCQSELTSTYTPAAGSYQLLFGAYGKGNNGPVAVVVDSVSVPEEGSIITYVVIGILAMLLLRRRIQLPAKRVV